MHVHEVSRSRDKVWKVWRWRLAWAVVASDSQAESLHLWARFPTQGPSRPAWGLLHNRSPACKGTRVDSYTPDR
eukprot:9473458-Pyramimonas_sp.AAC.4